VRVRVQVRGLQLDRDQSQMLLDNIQQRHKQDMELVENAHKYDIISVKNGILN